MISILQGLRTHLLGDTSIEGLVGARIYPLRLPQKAVMPAIVIQRISVLREQHLRGVAGLARPRIQVDCWATTHDAATALANLVRIRLDGFAGLWSDASSPPTVLHVVALFANEQDLFEEEILGGLCRHSADYFVWHSTAEGTL